MEHDNSPDQGLKHDSPGVDRTEMTFWLHVLGVMSKWVELHREHDRTTTACGLNIYVQFEDLAEVEFPVRSCHAHK